jgi:F-type H+-transporting ATPase subunit gamma
MSGKYRKLQKTLKGFIKFKDVLKAIKFVSGASLASLRKNLNNKFESLQNLIPLFDNNQYSDEYINALVICVTEDRGCRGPHNNDIIDYTKSLITTLEENDVNINLFCIGLKGYNVLSKLYLEKIIGSLVNYKDAIYAPDMMYLILTELIKLTKFNYDRCFLVFNQYVGTLIQKVASYELSSYNEFQNIIYKRIGDQDKTIIYFTSLLENSEFNIENLYYFGLSAILSDVLSDNKYSFLASRFFAMDTAIQNVEELISLLTITFNKARQEAITTELTEIITCKEAIK